MNADGWVKIILATGGVATALASIVGLVIVAGSTGGSATQVVVQALTLILGTAVGAAGPLGMHAMNQRAAAKAAANGGTSTPPTPSPSSTGAA